MLPSSFGILPQKGLILPIVFFLEILPIISLKSHQEKFLTVDIQTCAFAFQSQVIQVLQTVMSSLVSLGNYSW